MLKVSIVTICYNNASTIEDTLKSVVNQNYANIEYIIIDGRSTDNTIQIVEKYRSGISKIISEPDEGIYFALNKGIACATGEIVAILHSDDFYPDNNVITEVVKAFKESRADTVYGDLQYVDRKNTNDIKRYWKSGSYSPGLFIKGWMPPHPAFFVKKKCYEQFGSFNTLLKSAADYEFMLRLLHKNKCSTFYIPKVLVKMRTGGKSNISILNRIKANREDKQAWIINGIKPGFFTFIRKPMSKLKQFF
jgi:glycosyltransferase involved in cell wall biosynthesis